MKSFEEKFIHEKNELTEALILFGEGKRLNKALADLEMNRPEFYKFYEAGQQSRQAEIDELQKRIDEAIAILSSKKKMYVDMVIEVEKALKGGNK